MSSAVLFLRAWLGTLVSHTFSSYEHSDEQAVTWLSHQSLKPLLATRRKSLYSSWMETAPHLVASQCLKCWEKDVEFKSCVPSATYQKEVWPGADFTESLMLEMTSEIIKFSLWLMTLSTSPCQKVPCSVVSWSWKAIKLRMMQGHTGFLHQWYLRYHCFVGLQIWLISGSEYIKIKKREIKRRATKAALHWEGQWCKQWSSETPCRFQWSKQRRTARLPVPVYRFSKCNAQ